MKYLDSYINKINNLHEVLAFIRIYPQNKEGYVELYQQYLLSYPYQKKHLDIASIFIGSLGGFHFVDTMFNLPNWDHEFTMSYKNELVVVASEKNYYVTASSYENEFKFENKFLHTLQNINTKHIKTGFKDLLYKK